MVLTPPITGQAVRVTATPVSDDLTLICVVHGGVAVPYAEVYSVQRSGATRAIGRSEALGKDDSAAARAYADGTVRLFVSEADPGQGGATAHVRVYDFPGAVPPTPPPTVVVDATARSLAQQALTAVRDLIVKLHQV